MTDPVQLRLDGDPINPVEVRHLGIAGPEEEPHEYQNLPELRR